RPWIAQRPPRNGSGNMRRLGSPDVATSATESRKGAPKPRPMPKTPVTMRCRVPSVAENLSPSSPTEGPIGPGGHALPRVDLEGVEEVRDLECRRLGGVGAVNGIGLDRRREVLADRAGGGLRRIGRPHQLAHASDRMVALEDHRHTGPAGHERAQARVERALAVDGGEAAGLARRAVNEPGGEDLETGLLEAADDLPDRAAGDGVGLDDGESALDGHGGLHPFLPSTRATVAPISAGLFTVVTPAASSARIFSAAVPRP